jgi:hypothetical protein
MSRTNAKPWSGTGCDLVLDPAWFTLRARRASDNWVWTLGPAQYDGFKRALETSHARFKFVFIHHLVGRADRLGRGGVELAPFYGCGGKNADDSDGFASHRPGWALPIHQLLLSNHVAAVRHGHDQRTPQSSLLEINPFLDTDGQNTSRYVNPTEASYRRETCNRDTHNQPRQISKQIVWNCRSGNSRPEPKTTALTAVARAASAVAIIPTTVLPAATSPEKPAKARNTHR